MDLSKLTLSDRVIGGSGIALLIFSFFPWFKGKSVSFGGVTVGGGSVSGWHYFLFGIIPVLLAVAIVAVIAITRFGSNINLPELPIPWALALLIAAGIAAFLVVIKLLIGESGGTRAFGLFISALAALGLVGGAFLKFREEGGATTTGRGSGPSTPF